MTNRLIIGIGNLLRGDDAFGPKVVASLQEDHPDLAHYLVEQSDLTRIIDHWIDRDVVVIDAIQTLSGKTGDVHHFSELEQLRKENKKPYSSHRLDLAEIVTLSQRLGRQPRSIHFIGAEGANWGFGEPLSNDLRSAMPLVIMEILRYFDHPLPSS